MPVVPSLLTAGISEDDDAGAGDLLDDDADGDRVGAGAVVGLRHVHRLEVRRDQRRMHVPRELTELVDLGRPRSDLVVGEGTHRGTEQVVLVGGAEEVGHLDSCVGWGGSSTTEGSCSSRIGRRSVVSRCRETTPPMVGDAPARRRGPVSGARPPGLRRLPELVLSGQHPVAPVQLNRQGVSTVGHHDRELGGPLRAVPRRAALPRPRPRQHRAQAPSRVEPSTRPGRRWVTRSGGAPSEV